MKDKMNSKELRVIINIFSSSLIFLVYSLIVYFRKIQGNLEIANDPAFWGKTFVMFLPIAIGGMIAIYIIFAIINKIATSEDLDTRSDEMDKLIELRSLRVSHWSFTGGFLLAMGSQAIGMDLWVLFAVMFASGFLGSIAEGFTQLYYYKRGI